MKGVVIEMSKAGTNLRTRYRRAVKARDKLLSKIRKARDAGNTHRLIELERLYLNSYHAKFTATVIANRKLKPHLRVPTCQIPAIAASLNPWEGTDEPVTVYAKPKKDKPNDCRLIYEFGIRNRALQYLTQELLSSVAQPRPYQFLLGGGRDAAGKAVQQNLISGYVWIAHMDVQNFYPSFDGSRLAQFLPVDERVVRHVLLPRHLNLVPGGTLAHPYGNCSNPTEAALDPNYLWEKLAESFAFDPRQGIPQGSAASPYVAELVLSAIDLPQCGRICIFADNILLMAVTEIDLQAMMKALCSALECHPVGELWLDLKCATHASKGFDFLGYRISAENSKVRIEPSSENIKDFNFEFNRMLTRFNKTGLSPKICHGHARRSRRYVRGWCAAFSLWDGVSDWKAAALKKIPY